MCSDDKNIKSRWSVHCMIFPSRILQKVYNVQNIKSKWLVHCMIFSIKNFTESNNVQNIKSKWSVHCQGFCIQGAWGSAPPPPPWETPLPARGATIPTPIASQGHCLPPYPRRRDYRRDCIGMGSWNYPAGVANGGPRKYPAGVADGGGPNLENTTRAWLMAAPGTTTTAGSRKDKISFSPLAPASCQRRDPAQRPANGGDY